MYGMICAVKYFINATYRHKREKINHVPGRFKFTSTIFYFKSFDLDQANVCFKKHSYFLKQISDIWLVTDESDLQPYRLLFYYIGYTNLFWLATS